jgi:hypothetical protein
VGKIGAATPVTESDCPKGQWPPLCENPLVETLTGEPIAEALAKPMVGQNGGF